MSEFRSATTDFTALRKRKEELFGEPWDGTKNGIDTTPREEPKPADPGHYPGY
jgi:hypothetical protein